MSGQFNATRDYVSTSGGVDLDDIFDESEGITVFSGSGTVTNGPAEVVSAPCWMWSVLFNQTGDGDSSLLKGIQKLETFDGMWMRLGQRVSAGGSLRVYTDWKKILDYNTPAAVTSVNSATGAVVISISGS